MSRNSSGSYTLPVGNPVVSATTISTTWANTTLGDFATEITDSASRSGKGGFTAPVRGVDGTVAAPAVSFTNEPATGLYKAATGDVRVALTGVDALKLKSLAAADASGDADVTAGSIVTRTAGWIFRVVNNTVSKLLVDWQGLLTLASQTAPLQPAGIQNAITPNAGWTASQSPSYYKDACGRVHLMGFMTWATGASLTLFTLPAGFRPLSTRQFAIMDATANTLAIFRISFSGNVDLISPAAVNGHVYTLDGMSFLAEA